MIDTVIIKFILTLFNLYLIFYYFFYMKEESFFFFFGTEMIEVYLKKREIQKWVCLKS